MPSACLLTLSCSISGIGKGKEAARETKEGDIGKCSNISKGQHFVLLINVRQHDSYGCLFVGGDTLIGALHVL